MELLVVIVVVLAVGAVILLRKAHGIRGEEDRTACINNLKQIGIAYRVWANDHNGHFPAAESAANGGWKESLSKADQGFLCWTNYAIIASDMMGQSTRTVVCPSDERQAAEEFKSGPRTGIGGADAEFKDNRTLSYFVGVSASYDEQQSLLAGDRNLGGGTKPGDGYGFSPESGQGNDVAIETNSRTGPVCWSLKMHSQGKADGAGNILLGDGGVQQVSTVTFGREWQPVGGQTTHWPAGHVPPAPSFRVLFP